MLEIAGTGRPVGYIRSAAKECSSGKPEKKPVSGWVEGLPIRSKDQRPKSLNHICLVLFLLHEDLNGVMAFTNNGYNFGDFMANSYYRKTG